MGVVADVREIIQDLVAPELKELSVKLDALAQSQGGMETRLLKAIAQSEERILLLLKVADLSQQNAQLMKQLSEVHKEAQ